MEQSDLFHYLHIQTIMGEANEDYKVMDRFGKNIIAFRQVDLPYIGSRPNAIDKPHVDVENFVRKKELSNPSLRMKKAVIYNHAEIFDALCKFSQKPSTTSPEKSVSMLWELLREHPVAVSFLNNKLLLTQLPIRDELSILLYVALLAASQGFDPEIRESQRVTEKDIQKTILDAFPSAKPLSEAELLEQIRMECSSLPEIENYMMSYVSTSDNLLHLYQEFLSGKHFFDLFSIPQDQQESLRHGFFARIDSPEKSLFSDTNYRRVVELMLFFKHRTIRTDLLMKIDPNLLAPLLHLHQKGIVKEGFAHNTYHLGYGWFFYLDEVCGLLSHNAIYYVEEFPLLPKLAELKYTDLLYNALVQLDFTDAVPLKKYISHILKAGLS